ncbi:hypothetical protein L211DRAFT_845024 [Terfezia boudieri ATCC MYA-4762]|uniref:Uncharacterized protein n=1 Tax=Terfezia boudieri ATCC MYA-4762 TaxID=1051890 RepID=A0A3N4M1F1_9PEZI|nr:hypothetical protein L211DRAFT_845024 [Terfezia boudieri ATCC MYA-4762]
MSAKWQTHYRLSILPSGTVLRLTHGNFAAWSNAIKYILIGMDCWNIVLGTELTETHDRLKVYRGLYAGFGGAAGCRVLDEDARTREVHLETRLHLEVDLDLDLDMGEPRTIYLMGVKREFSLREKYEICLEREKQLKEGKKMRLDEFRLLFPDQRGKGIPKSTLSDILAMSDEILKNPLVDGAHKKKKRIENNKNGKGQKEVAGDNGEKDERESYMGMEIGNELYFVFELIGPLPASHVSDRTKQVPRNIKTIVPATTESSKRKVVPAAGSQSTQVPKKRKKYLQDIQVATTISVASMLTLDSATDELQEHVSVLDQGVDKATKWCRDYENVLVIIEENLQKLTSPPADNTTEFPSTDTTTAALSAPPSPTLAEVLSQLDNLNRFFQRMSVSALAFPHTPTQLSIQDLVDTIGQAQEGLKYFQQKHKVQAYLHKDFWVPTSSSSNTSSGSAN